ncbi:RHS repeat protein, partial [Endozoicomonas sp. SM1973]
MKNKLFFLAGMGSLVISTSVLSDIVWTAPGHPSDPLLKPGESHSQYGATPIEACKKAVASYNRVQPLANRAPTYFVEEIAFKSPYWGNCVNRYNKSSSSTWLLPLSAISRDCGEAEYLDDKAMACINKNAQPQVCAGNPVNIATGNKIQWFTDLALSHLKVKRLYLQVGTLSKWYFSFQRTLNVFKYNNDLVAHITRDSGQEIVLYQQDGTWQDDDASGYQVKTLDDSGQYQLLTPSNATETYDNQGRLIKVEFPSQQAMELAYEDNKIVISQGNISVNYHLNDKHQITSIESGSLVRNYQYDEQGRLSGTDFNGKYKETYHYENGQFPVLLTGITNANNQRYATWEYDSKGRATVSKHAGDVDEFTFSYPDENSTTVTNPLGKKTTYHFEEINGFRKVKSVEGHASANCLAANKNYEYFDSGLLKSKTDWQGVKTTYQYNDRGLTTEKVEAAGTLQARTTTTQWHNQFFLPIQVSEPGKLTTYQYTEAGQLQSTTETDSAGVASSSSGVGNDNNGLSSQQEEASETTTDTPNTDGGRATDGLEVDNEATPSTNNSTIDSDNDGFTNAQELVLGRNP